LATGIRPARRGSAIWIGIDDTDSPAGGCTTWVLSELLAEARSAAVDLIGEPRLVRLNPNVPWKTRGNAALAARFGRGYGPRRRRAEVDGRPVWSYARGGELSPGPARDWVERAWKVVLRGSRRGDPGTDPAMVAAPRRLPGRMYWEAVRSVVDLPAVGRALRGLGAEARWEGSERGLVGAAAAIAWPGVRSTWELLAYRSPDRWGLPREVDRASVRRMAHRRRGLFLCEDRRTRRVLVVPHTPCPILFGLRGIRPDAPLGARRDVRSEPVDRWVLFRTNQASGDHLLPRRFSEMAPFTSGRLVGVVQQVPVARAGGHVAFSISDQDGRSLDCLAFEPTKTLPDIARSLVPGDTLRVWGSRADDPVVRLEGIEILRLATRRGPRRPPRCPTCRRTADSLGRQRGFRCARCRRRWPPEAVRVGTVAARYPVGTYHPTPSARRHLAPLGPEA
jgi:tRNA(Ile2)-agmatinylcytidine synthase